MTITLPPELAQRIRRAHAFQEWSNGTGAETMTTEAYALMHLEGICKSLEEDMIVDQDGFFLMNKMWQEPCCDPQD